MANLKDIISAPKAGKTSPLEALRAAVSTWCEAGDPYIETSNTEREASDDFDGIMDGPEMVGFEFGTPVHGGEVLTRDQHAKRIVDLT